MKNIKEIVLGLVILGGVVFAASLWIGGNVSAQEDKDSSVTSRKSINDSKDSITDLGQMDVVPYNDAASKLKIRRVEAPVAARAPEAVGTDQGSESEPNNSFATADVLTGTDGRIRGANFSGIAGSAATDEDWYSFTTTVAGARVYAALINSAASQQDSILEVIGPGGAPVLELDDQDGSFGGGSSSVAGTVLGAPGTYYLRATNFSTTAPIAPYDLYFAVRDPATITPETEPNGNGTPQALPASQYVSGTIGAAGDIDTFTFTAAAGDTVFVSQDLDPERNNVAQYNGRIGVGIFGTPGSFLVTSDAGTFDTIDSEAAAFTVAAAGTYQVYTDAQVAGNEGATATYNFTISIIPANPPGTCTTYTNAVSTPIPDAALTTSTIAIPDSKIISSLRVITNITHPNYPDLDVHLRSPAASNNDNGLYADVGVSTQTGAQVYDLQDDRALPVLFTIVNGGLWRPRPAYRLGWFKGENSLGTWSLDIRDDSSAVATAGTLNSWSLEVCEEAAPTGTLIYNQDFEASDGGYTHSGTADEWERGTPATAAQTVTSPFIAAFSNCASGTNCWKTDLDNTYDSSSSQDLVSPTLNLTQYAGSIRLYWQQRYQMESISFDRIWVRVTNLDNAADTRMVWFSDHQTMGETVGLAASLGNVPESAGWGRYNADISDFAGKRISVTFHLESDSSINYGGWAVDDVQLRHIGVVAANVPVGGRVLSATGQAVSNARVVLADANGNSRVTFTSPFGYYNFEDVQAGRTYTLSASAKRYRFSPVIVTVNDEITGLDIIANPGE
jgi:subtilisin-like proprotein convertase family protein